MCMHISSEITHDVRNSTWPRVCYKTLEWDHASQSFYSPYQRYMWKPGVHVSSEEPDKLPPGREERVLRHGFHVFLSKERAEACCQENQVVVELICQLDHFMAAGFDNGCVEWKSAVFTEVTLTEEEHARAVAIGKKLPEQNEWEDEEDWEDDGYDYDDEDDYDDDDDYDEYDDDDDDWDEEEEEEEWEDEEWEEEEWD